MVKTEIVVASRQAAMAAKGVNVSVESVLAEIEVQIELKWNPLETILFGREEGFSFLDEADRLYIVRVLETAGWTCETQALVSYPGGVAVIDHRLKIW